MEYNNDHPSTNYQIQEDKVNGYYKLISQTKEARREIKVRQKTWIGELIERYKIIERSSTRNMNSQSHTQIKK